ncbi:MAG: hypothetical protein HQ567_00810 [Candidatus Nealsonbacteria bacterium]|nr:hypothetical protein [Candidatus Nealsonbacteria bacterium]
MLPGDVVKYQSTPRRRLLLEQLEDRCLLAAGGG